MSQGTGFGNTLGLRSGFVQSAFGRTVGNLAHSLFQVRGGLGAAAYDTWTVSAERTVSKAGSAFGTLRREQLGGVVYVPKRGATLSSVENLMWKPVLGRVALQIHGAGSGGGQTCCSCHQDTAQQPLSYGAGFWLAGITCPPRG